MAWSCWDRRCPLSDREAGRPNQLGHSDRSVYTGGKHRAVLCCRREGVMPFSFPRQSRSVALLHVKRYDAALDAAEDTLTRHPEFAEEWARKARALGFLGKNKEAAAAFKQERSLETNIGDWDTEFRVLTALKRYPASRQMTCGWMHKKRMANSNSGRTAHRGPWPYRGERAATGPCRDRAVYAACSR
jgi:hypothetical protein